MPTSSRILSHRRRGHERAARPLARPRGAGAPHRVPHPAPQPTPSQTSRSGALGRARVSRKGRRASLPPPPHTHLARPPSAPGPRARLAPPRESHLPRFGIGGGGGSSDAYLLWRQFLCAAPRAWGSARARTTTHHRSPVDRAPARAGASPRLADPTFTKGGKVGKRAADARTHPTPTPSATPLFLVPCPGNVSTALARGGRRRFPPPPTAPPPPRTRSALRAPAPPPRR